MSGLTCPGFRPFAALANSGCISVGLDLADVAALLRRRALRVLLGELREVAAVGGELVHLLGLGADRRLVGVARVGGTRNEIRRACIFGDAPYSSRWAL